MREDTHNDSSRGRQTTDADSSTKSDPKDSDSGSRPDSIEVAIASARKDLFRESSGAGDEDDAITVATSRSRKWKPIRRSTTDSGNSVVDLTTPSNNRRGTTFATSTNFKEKEKAATSTPEALGGRGR